METKPSTCAIEDAFDSAGRGLVLVGLVHGPVVTGQYLLLANSRRWPIRGIGYVNIANQDERFGLLVAAPVISRQEVATGIIRSTIPILDATNV